MRQMVDLGMMTPADVTRMKRDHLEPHEVALQQKGVERVLAAVPLSLAAVPLSEAQVHNLEREIEDMARRGSRTNPFTPFRLTPEGRAHEVARQRRERRARQRRDARGRFAGEVMSPEEFAQVEEAIGEIRTLVPGAMSQASANRRLAKARKQLARWQAQQKARTNPFTPRAATRLADRLGQVEVRARGSAAGLAKARKQLARWAAEAEDPLGLARDNPSAEALRALRELEEGGVLAGGRLGALGGAVRGRGKAKKQIKDLRQEIARLERKMDTEIGRLGGEAAFLARAGTAAEWAGTGRYEQKLASYKRRLAAHEATLPAYEDVDETAKAAIARAVELGLLTPAQERAMREKARGKTAKGTAPQKPRKPRSRTRKNPGVTALAVARPNPAPRRNTEEKKMARRSGRGRRNLSQAQLAAGFGGKAAQHRALRSNITEGRLATKVQKGQAWSTVKSIPKTYKTQLMATIRRALKRKKIATADKSHEELLAIVAKNPKGVLYRAIPKNYKDLPGKMPAFWEAVEAKEKAGETGADTGAPLSAAGKAAVVLGVHDSGDAHALVGRVRPEKVTEDKYEVVNLDEGRLQNAERQLAKYRKELTTQKRRVETISVRTKEQMAEVRAAAEGMVRVGLMTEKAAEAKIAQAKKPKTRRSPGMGPARAKKLETKVEMLDAVIKKGLGAPLTAREARLVRSYGARLDPDTGLRTYSDAQKEAGFAGAAAAKAAKAAKARANRSNGWFGNMDYALPWENLQTPRGQSALTHYGVNVAGGAVGGFVAGTVVSNAAIRMWPGTIGNALGRWGVPLGGALALASGRLGTGRLPPALRAWGATGLVASAVAQAQVTKLLTGNWFGGALFRRLLTPGVGSAAAAAARVDVEGAAGFGDLYDEAFDPGLYVQEGATMPGAHAPTLVDGLGQPFYAAPVDGMDAYIEVGDHPGNFAQPGMDAYIEVDEGGGLDGTDAYIEVDELGEFYAAPVDGLGDDDEFYAAPVDGLGDDDEYLEDGEDTLDAADLHQLGLAGMWSDDYRWGRVRVGKAKSLRAKYGPAMKIYRCHKRGYAIVGLPHNRESGSGGQPGVPISRSVPARQPITMRVPTRHPIPEAFDSAPTLRAQQKGVFSEGVFGQGSPHAFS
jgi:hypothetical protein